MVYFASHEDAQKSKRWWDGSYMDLVGNYVYDYFGRDLAGPITDCAPDKSVRIPQAFFVEQAPNSRLPAHFHMIDQFQVLFGGGGSIGRHEIQDFGIHYTNAFTSYGPIDAGENGFNYFTLRNSWDGTGAHRMPESRAELKRVPRRHLLLQPPMPLAPDQLASLERQEVETLHEMESDGLGVWIYRLPKGTAATGPAPGNGAGQYWIVIGGSLIFQGNRLSKLSCLFVPETDDALSFQAGDDGLEVLVMQFPKAREDDSSPDASA
jgi:hypothetical protein